MENREIARLLSEVADLMEIGAEDGFRIRSYRNAASTIESYPERIEDILRNPERKVTEIPGIGPWTAQGALIIALGREDVVLPGDLALRKAVRGTYRLDHLPTEEEVLVIAEKWRPYRSLATAYLFSAAFEEAQA